MSTIKYCGVSFCRKRQLDEEQKQIDAIKKEKEWKQEWDVSVTLFVCALLL